MSGAAGGGAALLPGLEGYAKRDLALGQWDTDPVLARALVRWARVGEPGSLRVLEPSAGIGNIALEAARALELRPVGEGRERASLTCLELDPERARVLSERLHGLARWRRFAMDLRCGDFLSFAPEEPLASVAVANPPFENNGELEHAVHASRCAHRVCFIARLESLGSVSRRELWEALSLDRLAILTPRPPFGGAGNGMHEIAFFEVRRRQPESRDLARVEWLDWRAFGNAAQSSGGAR